MIRVVFTRIVGGPVRERMGAQFEGRGIELYLDGARVAYWHHTTSVWLDENGDAWDGFRTETVSDRDQRWK